jgi:hypothetical protein
MALTNLLAPIPKWVLINNQGTVAGGAKLFTYSSRNKILQKPVYQDTGFTTPWTNPIIFDLNGTQGPFYWTVNSADLTDTYYLEAFDSDDNPLWTLDNYFPPGSGGGGGDTTTYLPLTNYIANNQFIDHIDDVASPIGLTDLVIAPSNHKGFTPSLINPISTTTAGVVGPDIRFMKDSLANADTITFPLFIFGLDPLIGDVTPVDYVRYQCTTGNPGESYKVFQFPITQKVKNLNTQTMSFLIWAKSGGTDTITPQIRQYFGSAPTASPEVITPLTPINLTATWTQYKITVPVPSVVGKSLGTPGLQTDDDALYIQILLPLNTACDISFIKPALYLGDISPDQEFDDYDQINSINSTPRTGDVKTSYLSSAPKGWIINNNGSIGNVGSGGTTRANQDTFQLYKTLWDGVSNTFAPVSTGRGATAVADFIAGKTLNLPRALGRLIGGSGGPSDLTVRALGEWIGSETSTIVQNNLPAAFTGTISSTTLNNIPGGGGSTLSGLSGGGTTPVNFVIAGGSQPFTTMSPSSFMNVLIKL